MHCWQSWPCVELWPRGTAQVLVLRLAHPVSCWQRALPRTRGGGVTQWHRVTPHEVVIDRGTPAMLQTEVRPVRCLNKCLSWSFVSLRSGNGQERASVCLVVGKPSKNFTRPCFSGAHLSYCSMCTWRSFRGGKAAATSWPLTPI